MVPMAPSSTRMRSRISLRNAARVSMGDAGTMMDSKSGCLLHRRPQAEQVADRVDEVGAVHGVEVETGDAAVEQIDHLFGGHGSRDQLAGGRILSLIHISE